MSTTGSREAAFIGKITAGATHEIRNVLAIIKESAGLIDDLMQASITRGPLDGDRVLRATQRIDMQVARGAEIVTSLNRFAHSLDLECRAIDLAEEIRQVVFLSQRFARRKSQTLTALPGGAVSAFRGNSLAVQMALSAVLELCMEGLPDRTTIEMWSGAADGKAWAEVKAELNDAAVQLPVSGAAWERTCDLVRDVGATLQPTGSGTGLLLVFENER